MSAPAQTSELNPSLSFSAEENEIAIPECSKKENDLTGGTESVDNPGDTKEFAVGHLVYTCTNTAGTVTAPAAKSKLIHLHLTLLLPSSICLYFQSVPRRRMTSLEEQLS